MKISNALLAEDVLLPPIGDVLYQYVIAGNGLFIRAEDSRIEALVKVAPARLTGLADLVPGVTLKIDRVPGVWLRSIYRSALRHMPNEAMYQLHFNGDQHHAVTRTWRCTMPTQAATATSVRFIDDGESVIDLHSHNSMPAFFSDTDDGDEQGFRFYAVIGKLDKMDLDLPEIRLRVGVYGHFMDVPASTVFTDVFPFIDVYGQDAEPDQASLIEFEHHILESMDND